MSVADIVAGNLTFADAAAKRDLDTIANLYSADAILLPPDSELVVGRDAIRQLWQSMFAGGLSSVTVTSVKIEVDGDMATDVGHVSMSMRPPEGDGYVVEMKFLAVWKKIDGRWVVQRDMFNTRAPAK